MQAHSLPGQVGLFSSKIFCLKNQDFSLQLSRAGEPKSEPERQELHDLAGAGAILFFLQEPEHLKKLEWSRSWSRSWRKLVRLHAPAVFKNFVKNNDF